MTFFSLLKFTLVTVNYFVVERYIQTSVLNTALNLFFYNLKLFSFCFALATLVAHISSISTFHNTFLNPNFILQMILLYCLTVLQRDSLGKELPI